MSEQTTSQSSRNPDDPLFTPETRFNVLKYLRQGGLRLDSSAGAIGVDPSLVVAWCERGEREGQGPYFQFMLEVAKAKAEARERVEALLLAQAERNPRVAKAIAERRFGRRYPARDALWRLREEHAKAKNDLLRAKRDVEAARAGQGPREVKIVRDLSEIPAEVRDATVESAVNEAGSSAKPDGAWRDVNRAPIEIVPEDFVLEEEDRGTDNGDDAARGVGRPTKYTPELGRMIKEHVSKGFSLATAADFAGIGRSTAYRWFAKGRLIPNGDLAEFTRSIDRAMNAVEAVIGTILFKHALEGDWRTQLWWCERMYPEHWGRQDPDGETTAQRLRLEIAIMNDQRQRLLANTLSTTQPLYVFVPPMVRQLQPAA